MVFNFCEKCGSVLTGTVADDSRPTCDKCSDGKLSLTEVPKEKQEMLEKLNLYFREIIQTITHNITPRYISKIDWEDFPNKSEIEVLKITNRLSDNLVNSFSSISDNLLNQLVEVAIKKLILDVDKVDIQIERPVHLGVEDFEGLYYWLKKSEINSELSDNLITIPVDFRFFDDLRAGLFFIGVSIYPIGMGGIELTRIYHKFLEDYRKPIIFKEFKDKFETIDYESPLKLEGLNNKGEVKYFLWLLKEKGYLCVERPNNIIEITL